MQVDSGVHLSLLKVDGASFIHHHTTSSSSIIFRPTTTQRVIICNHLSIISQCGLSMLLSSSKSEPCPSTSTSLTVL